MKMSEKTYDILAWVGKIVLPALAVLYSSVGDTWGLPYVEQIPKTLMALDVFLNALLGISSANYYKEISKVENDEIDRG